MWGKEVVFWQFVEKAVLVCLYKLGGEDAEKVFAVGIGAKRMKLIGKNEHGLVFIQGILLSVDGYIHASVGDQNQLKALMKMGRIIEIFAPFFLKMIRRSEM